MNIIKNRYTPDPKYGYIDIHEAANLLGISTSALYKKTAQKSIPFYQPSRRIYFKIDELKMWIESEPISQIQTQLL